MKNQWLDSQLCWTRREAIFWQTLIVINAMGLGWCLHVLWVAP